MDENMLFHYVDYAESCQKPSHIQPCRQRPENGVEKRMKSRFSAAGVGDETRVGVPRSKVSRRLALFSSFSFEEELL